MKVRYAELAIGNVALLSYKHTNGKDGLSKIESSRTWTLLVTSNNNMSRYYYNEKDGSDKHEPSMGAWSFSGKIEFDYDIMDLDVYA